MNKTVEEVTIQELNLDPEKKYLISVNFGDEVSKDVVNMVCGRVIDCICSTCNISWKNVCIFPFTATVKDISIEDAKPIKDLIDKLFKESEVK